jgi:UDP-GlcNAc:undecaprenyl-phosphate GlcNAc-1-phosphate transferase
VPFALPLQHLTAFTLGLAFCVLLVPVIVRVAHARGILDLPEPGRRAHTLPVPRLGGVAIFLGAAGAAGLVFLLSRHAGSLALPYPSVLPGLVLGSTLVFLTGLVDDLRGLRPSVKFALQLAAAGCVVAFDFVVRDVAIGKDGAALSLGVAAVPVTLLWITGVTNAVNLIDGIDGLAGTIVLIALITCAVTDAYLHPDASLVILLALAGTVVGFLRYNVTPARIFLGDSGSMTLGFFLSVRLILAATSADGVTYALVPLAGLAYPLLDTLVAILRRWLRGHPFSRADGRHIHHQFLAIGLPVRTTVVLLGSGFLGVAALGTSIAFAPPRFTLALVLAAGVVLFALTAYGLRWLGYEEFAEFAGSVRSVLRNARAAVREKISANDTALRIRRAASLAEVRAALAGHGGHTPALRLELLTVAEATSDDRRSAERREGSADTDRRREVRYDYPVGAGERAYVLRLSGPRPATGVHAHHERIAARIGPAIESWLSARQ